MKRTLSKIKSDIEATYETASINNILKSLLNPSIHACILIRLCTTKSRLTHTLIRNILISKHGIDVGANTQVGRGLRLPHPIGIVLGDGAKIGEGVTIYQNCTIGNKGGYPIIGCRTTIYPNSVIIGPIKLGKNCVIGANSFVNKSLEDATTYHN